MDYPFHEMNRTYLKSLLQVAFVAVVGFCLPGIAQEPRQPSLSVLNEALQSGERPVRIVCFGDSVTGLYYHTGGRRTYTDMLGIALRQIHPGANVEMINAGISGHTTANALSRIEKDVIARRPDLVTVMFGLNDMAKLPIEDYRKNLIEIVKRCRAAGAEVILCTPNAVITTETRPVEKLIQYCEVVRAVATEQAVTLCDSFAEFETMRARDPNGWRLMMSDEIHPNMAGHKAIAAQLARTITGQSTSLIAVGPSASPLQKTWSLLKEGKPVKILAMPPFDAAIEGALKTHFPNARLEITTWPVDGLSRYLIRKDASHRVRQMKPDLVLIAVPRAAAFVTREEFIHEQTWIVNYSQSFGKQEWDVAVIHPSVAEPSADSSTAETDALIRIITAAQDLTLVDRASGDDREAAEIMTEWVREELAAPSPKE